jgi:hypothetical protein
MDKVIRNGKVAVLYSPGYGAGWYSWNPDVRECLFHPDLVALVEQKAALEEPFKFKRKDEIPGRQELINAIKAKATELFGDDFFNEGARDLSLEWLGEGDAFRITERDGSEDIEYGPNDLVVA